jgi:hypothetical protein
MALGCSAVVAVLVVAGGLGIRWNGADPQPRPSLDDLRNSPAARLVYPGASVVNEVEFPRSCSRIGGPIQSGGCTGPSVDRNFDMTASPHQVVSWYQAALTARGWTQVTPTEHPPAPQDPRFGLCDYTREGLRLSLADLCVLPNFDGWDTVADTGFDFQLSRG